jgi:hypothetical protein
MSEIFVNSAITLCTDDGIEDEHVFTSRFYQERLLKHRNFLQ